MILDTVDRLSSYEGMHPLMGKVIQFLNETELDSLEPGRIVLQGDDLFVNVNMVQPLAREDARIEVHRKYIDIQIPITGNEEMGYTSESFLEAESQPYDPEIEAGFHGGQSHTWLQVRKGMFVVFFPGEGHAPAVTPVPLKKIVVKIKAV